MHKVATKPRALACRYKDTQRGRASQCTDQICISMLRCASGQICTGVVVNALSGGRSVQHCKICSQANGACSQVIDDSIGNTLCATSTLSPDIRDQLNGKLGADKVGHSGTPLGTALRAGIDLPRTLHGLLRSGHRSDHLSAGPCFAGSSRACGKENRRVVS